VEIWTAASGLENSAKTPPGYDRIAIFAQAAQATDIVVNRKQAM
jgi:hypothetical protein